MDRAVTIREKVSQFENHRYPEGVAWLLCGDRVLASLERASTRQERLKGLLNRDTCDGAMLLERTRSVHTLGMRFAIDVAHCDASLKVLRTTTMRPNRIGCYVRKAQSVLEAPAGSFERWGIEPGVELEVKE